MNDWGTEVLFIRDDAVQSCTTQYQEKAGTGNFYWQMAKNYSSTVKNFDHERIVGVIFFKQERKGKRMKTGIFFRYWTMILAKMMSKLLFDIK